MSSALFTLADPEEAASLPREIESCEPEMESSLHYIQLMLLYLSLDLFWKQRSDIFIGANLTIYFSPRQLKNEHFRGPDLFVVTDTEKRNRKSWVVWEEKCFPNVIIEILSDSTETEDRTTKKAIYQDTFKTPEYFWFNPETRELAGFRRVNNRYQPIAPQQGQLWSEELELFFGMHEGALRLFTFEGVLLPAGEELEARAKAAEQSANQERQIAAQERQRADREQQRAETAEQLAKREKQRAEQLAERLRTLGIDPDRNP